MDWKKVEICQNLWKKNATQITIFLLHLWERKLKNNLIRFKKLTVLIIIPNAPSVYCTHKQKNRWLRTWGKTRDECPTCKNNSAPDPTLRRQSVVVLCGFFNCIIIHAVQELRKVEWNKFLDSCTITVCNLRSIANSKISLVSWILENVWILH